MSEPSPNLRAFTPEEWMIVAGIYRRLGELTEALRLSSAKPAPDAEPTQATLDLEPGNIAKEIAKKPRTWCNTVKVWEEIWARYCRDGKWFKFQELAEPEFLMDVDSRTKGKVHFASMSRIMSVLRRADVAHYGTKGEIFVDKPTDELREAVERVAKKRKEAAA